MLREFETVGGRLNIAAGHSLGELTAFHAAGAIGYEETIRLATARGRAMHAAAEVEKGGMAAIVGAESDLSDFEIRTQMPPGTVIANRNAPDQLVISGPERGLEGLCDAAAAAGLRTKRLDVTGAWHSPAMTPARKDFAQFVLNAEIGDARFPVWSALDTVPVTNSEDIKNRLISLIDSPVEWARTTRAMIEFTREPRWIEIGPGKVLIGLLIASGARDSVYRCETPRMLARLMEALGGAPPKAGA